MPDAFDIGAEADGCRHNPAAMRIAETMSLRLGEYQPLISEYLHMLGYAPAMHLQALRGRGAVIVFAPTIAHWLVSRDASQRRAERGHRPRLTGDRRQAVLDEFAAPAPPVAAYDPETDALVLPSCRRGPDLLRSVLHELGHAVTHPGIRGREQRYAHHLNRLPKRIADHLAAGYADDVALLVAEVMAEAYAMLACGRHAELGPIASDLIGILERVNDQPEPPTLTWRIDAVTRRSSLNAPSESVQTVGPIPPVDALLPAQPALPADGGAGGRAA